MSANVRDEGRKGKHLNQFERGRIASLTEAGFTAYRIGKMLGRSPQTIRNELKRGTVTTLYKGFKEITKYRPESGQVIYEMNRKRCKVPLKVKQCKRFMLYIEEEVLRNKRSFDAARGRAIRTGLFSKEEVVCVTTLYSYAERGIIGVRNIDLPEKVSRRIKRAPRIRIHKRLRGRSIEERPKEINQREMFGHWEIDLVIGKISGDDALLTLTERKTKKEIIEKIPNKTMEEVMKALLRVEARVPYFNEAFKSITSDNGVEFSRLHELENGKTVRVYYAHPYSSWERGLNESTNRIIRRFIPKGRSIRRYSGKRIAEIEQWINTLPRRILDYRTADEAFAEELQKLLNEQTIETA